MDTKRDAEQGPGVQSGTSEKEKIPRDYQTRQEGNERSQKPAHRSNTPAGRGHKFNG